MAKTRAYRKLEEMQKKQGERSDRSSKLENSIAQNVTMPMDVEGADPGVWVTEQLRQGMSALVLQRGKMGRRIAIMILDSAQHTVLHLHYTNGEDEDTSG